MKSALVAPIQHEPCPVDPYAGPWLAPRLAMTYVGCKSIKGWYAWRKRHGIVARANGHVAKADLDRALRLKALTVRRMAPASLANLRKPWEVA